MSRVVGYCTVSDILVLGYTDMCVSVEIDGHAVCDGIWLCNVMRHVSPNTLTWHVHVSDGDFNTWINSFLCELIQYAEGIQYIKFRNYIT